MVMFLPRGGKTCGRIGVWAAFIAKLNDAEAEAAETQVHL
jgi:hypothetical protein